MVLGLDHFSFPSGRVGYMTLEDLVLNIRKHGDLNKTEVAKELGFSRVTLYNRLKKLRPRLPFEVKVLVLACKNGLIMDAIAFLLGQQVAPKLSKDSTLMRAAAFFPDLSPEELRAIRVVEDSLGGTEPLPIDMVEAIVKRMRGHMEHPPALPVSADGLIQSGEVGAEKTGLLT